MRDTDKRTRGPVPDAPESMSTVDRTSDRASDRTSAAQTAPIPVDEAGLERGGTMKDAPRLDEPVTGKPVTDRPMADEPVTGRSMSDKPMTDKPVTDKPITDKPITDKPITDKPRTGEPVTGKPRTGAALTDEPMFADDVADRLRTRWRELQADFVDDPERAVRAADDVVDEMMKTITERRQRLTGEWQGHTDTEELRLALRGYRSFFDTLLPH